jgi:hypothetical protein
VTDQRDRLGTKTIDVDRELLNEYQNAARILGQRGGRALVEEALRAFLPKVKRRVERVKPITPP